MSTSVRLLGDRYELLGLLASGGMGRVWRARDLRLNRQVAVKVLRSEFTGDPAFVARFRAEAQHAAALHHPNIASVFDYGEVEEDGERLAYLVMELVEGESLAELLARERRLDLPRALDVLRSTAAALAAAHATGLVHRDVKPGNVLMASDGSVKLTDFGIAWSASSVPLTGTGQVIGTAHYLSPEQAQGAKASPASDVYALGAVAYECLAGRRVFEGENSVQVAVMQIREEPEPLPADVPPPVRALVERTLVKDPADRFPDGAALLQAVDEVRAGRVPVGAGRTGTAVLPLPVLGAATPRPPLASRPSGGRRTAVRAAVALLTLLAVGWLVVGALRGSPDEPTTGATAEQTTEPATEAPAPIDLVAADYVGRPVADVQAELTGLGLVPRLQPVQTADVAEGEVTALDPLQSLLPGSTVTISHAVAPPPPPPAPAPETPAQEADEDEDDDDRDRDGNGNGNGNGRGNDKPGKPDKDDD
jgi:serine/threonine-protein kinase